MKDKRWYIECACNSFDHLIVLENDKIWNQLSITYRLYQYQSFWQRFKLAVKYLFNSTNESHWDTTLISEQEISKIRAWLDSRRVEQNDE